MGLPPPPPNQRFALDLHCKKKHPTDISAIGLLSVSKNVISISLLTLHLFDVLQNNIKLKCWLQWVLFFTAPIFI